MSIWPTRTIGEVCDVVNGGTPKTTVSEYWGGEHLWVTPAEMGKRVSPYIDTTERSLTNSGIANSSANPLPPNSVILSSRAPIGHLVINTVPMSFNQGCKGLIPKSGLHHKFLYYYLFANVELLNSLGTGATFKELPGGKLKEVGIPLPPMAEQLRIVAMLDEAFEGIAKVKSNTKRNLANAKDLQRAIVDRRLDTMAANIVPVPLDSLRVAGRVITYGVIKLGDPIENGVPCLRTSNVRWLDFELAGLKRIGPELSDEYRRTVLRGNEVLVNVRGTLGGVAVVPSSMAGWNISREVAMVPVDSTRVSPAFLAHWIGRSQSQAWLTGVLTGAAYTGINIEDLRTLPVAVPALEEQHRISQEIDEALSQARLVQQNYEQQARSLEALRSSLLDNAFAGQLPSKAAVVAPARAVAMTTTSEFTADILAFAYSKHATVRREKTLGRVKGQKILHLVESAANVDLGRAPIKDAAGPNDSTHMRNAEQWAAQNDYFTFVQRSGGGYDFKKGKAFDRLLAGAYARLAPHRDTIARMIDLVVPMDSEEAEVLATVHAAWNNLLIDGVEPTRQAILHEARQNWSASKLNIPEAKFENAIGFIKQNDLVPDGSAKPVRAKQESLF